MAFPLYTPRVNNNDDSVRLTGFLAAPGSSIKQGDPVADVETDKATFTVEADRDGYLLAFCHETGDTIAVGSVLAWIGDTATDEVPAAASGTASAVTSNTPTLKAAILLSQYGLNARDVPVSGERLSAADVGNYVTSRGLTAIARSAPAASSVAGPARTPPEAGKKVELSPVAHGMLRTVAWHKSEAVPGYVEMAYDASPWTEYAAAFQKNNRLMLSPLLALLAWRLTRAVTDRPLANSTIFDEQSWQYDHINLGFTVQVGANLMIVVVREAETLDEGAFVTRLTSLQRGAMRNSLRPKETSGATIGFSSMARWPVTRHVPVLLPHTAIMLAHTAASAQNACLGATYDHRVLNGEDVVHILRTVTAPPAPA